MEKEENQKLLKRKINFKNIFYKKEKEKRKINFNKIFFIKLFL